MKTVNVNDITLTSMSRIISSVLGAKQVSSPDGKGFKVERVNKIENRFQRLELRKVRDSSDKQNNYYIEIEEGVNEPKVIKFSWKFKELKTLYFSSPNVLIGEEKKISFLIVGGDTVTMVETDEHMRTQLMLSKSKKDDADNKQEKFRIVKL